MLRFYEIFSYLFLITTIVLISIGAVRAFHDFILGKHHEEQK
jgi:uncharacterized membrane protein